MQEQKDRAKAATAKISVTGDIKYAKVEEQVGSTEFLGYEKNESEIFLCRRTPRKNLLRDYQ